MDFNAGHELWNPLNKAVTGKFHMPGGQSKHNLSQDQSISHVLDTANRPNL